jgi:hypothetical protein
VDGLPGSRTGPGIHGTIPNALWHSPSWAPWTPRDWRLTISQRPNALMGPGFGEYGNALPMVERDYISREPAPAFLDTNFCAYPAVGVLHYLLATDDLGRVRDWWPMVRGAMDFVTALQRADGTISWAFEAVGTDDDDALLAGNASVAKSLECAIALAARLGEDASAWIAAREALVAALRTSPELFDRKGGGRRFAMDWYYPVLSGALDPPTAAKRLQSQTATFVDPVRGCRCVSDEPWVTVAETCELAMAYLSVDQGAEAASLLEAISSHCDVDGVFWMGWQYEEETVWPKETPSWTQAAVILAHRCPAWRLRPQQAVDPINPIAVATDAGS